MTDHAGYEYRRDENDIETWQPVDCDGQPTGPAVTVQPVTDTHDDTELVEPADFLRQCAATFRDQADEDDTGEGEAMGNVFDIAARALDAGHRCLLVKAVLDLAVNLSGVEVVDTSDAAAV